MIERKHLPEHRQKFARTLPKVRQNIAKTFK